MSRFGNSCSEEIGYAALWSRGGWSHGYSQAVDVKVKWNNGRKEKITARGQRGASSWQPIEHSEAKIQ